MGKFHSLDIRGRVVSMVDSGKLSAYLPSIEPNAGTIKRTTL